MERAAHAGGRGPCRRGPPMSARSCKRSDSMSSANKQTCRLFRRSFPRHQKHPTLEKVSTLTEPSRRDTAHRHGHEQVGAVAGAELKLMCLRGHCSGPTEERPTKSMSTRVLKIVIRNGKAKAATATGKRRVACGRMLGQGDSLFLSSEPTRWPMRCRVPQGRPRTLSRQAPSLPVRSLGCTRHLTTASILRAPHGSHLPPACPSQPRRPAPVRQNSGASSSMAIPTPRQAPMP